MNPIIGAAVLIGAFSQGFTQSEALTNLHIDIIPIPPPVKFHSK